MLLVVLLALPVAHAAPRARFQDAGCPCEHCVTDLHNSVADCESLGLDCGCLLDCKCQHCVVAMDNSIADCESLGLDCSCYHAAPSGGGACADFEDRTNALNNECCDEVTEDCSSGRPAVCNVGCARVLLPYFDDCGGALGADGVAAFADVVALCHAAEDAPTWHLGDAGASCTDTCSGVDLSCHDGDWGAHDEASMRAAFQAAGEDADSLCPVNSDSFEGGGFRSRHQDGSTPFMYVGGDSYASGTGTCFYQVAGKSYRCSDDPQDIYRKLCMCTTRAMAAEANMPPAYLVSGADDGDLNGVYTRMSNHQCNGKPVFKMGGYYLKQPTGRSHGRDWIVTSDSDCDYYLGRIKPKSWASCPSNPDGCAGKWEENTHECGIDSSDGSENIWCPAPGVVVMELSMPPAYLVSGADDGDLNGVYTRKSNHQC
eukprot:COSAG06_NODE_9968_length_1780_cov_0.831053_1_plen_428_part_01